MEISSSGEAIARLQQILPGMIIKDKIDVGTVIEHNTGRYFVMFKREYYRNFKYHFPELKKDNDKSFGWAQIMSMSLLNWACSNNIAWIVFITPDGKAYRCSAQKFKDYVELYGTEVPHLKGEVAMPLDYFDNLEKWKKE